MILNEVARAADPALAAKLAENSSYLCFELIAGKKPYCGLNANSAEDGEFVGVFIEVEVIGHSGGFLPRVNNVESDIYDSVRDRGYAAVGMKTCKDAAGMNVINNLLHIRIDYFPPELRAEKEVAL